MAGAPFYEERGGAWEFVPGVNKANDKGVYKLGGNVVATVDENGFTDVAGNAAEALKLRAMRSIIGNVVGGSARKRVLFLGDSTIAGMIGGGGNSPGARIKSPTSVAALLLNGAGIPARADAMFGNAFIASGSPSDYSAYNPDVAFGAGWAVGLGGPQYLSGCFWTNSTTTNAMTFTPQRPANRFDIYYIKAGGSGNGTFSVTDSGGALGGSPIDTNAGTYNVYKTTFTRTTADLTPISIQRTGTGAAIYIGGIDPWNSTIPELCLLNAARAGGMASEMLSAGAPPMAKGFIDVIAADGHYVEYGLNEKNSAVAISSFLASLNAVIDNCQILSPGAVAVGISAPATLGNGYNLTPDWRQAIVDTANSQVAPLVDHYSRFISREISSSDYSDQVHLAFSGYSIKGRAIFDMLVS